MYEVVEGLPIPERQCKVECNHKYPWKKLQLGDSFDVPLHLARSVLSAASQRHKKYSEKYLTRRVGDVIRVWRTA